MMHAARCAGPLAQPFGPTSSSQRPQTGAACRQLEAGAGSSALRPGGRRPLAVECKKRQQQRAQQAAAKAREQQVTSSSSSSSNSLQSSTSLAPPMSYTLGGPGTSQQLDLGNIEKLEVRGNELVLTMREPPGADGGGAAGPPSHDVDEVLATVRGLCWALGPRLPWGSWVEPSSRLVPVRLPGPASCAPAVPFLAPSCPGRPPQGRHL